MCFSRYQASLYECTTHDCLSLYQQPSVIRLHHVTYHSRLTGFPFLLPLPHPRPQVLQTMRSYSKVLIHICASSKAGIMVHPVITALHSPTSQLLVLLQSILAKWISFLLNSLCVCSPESVSNAGEMKCNSEISSKPSLCRVQPLL